MSLHVDVVVLGTGPVGTYFANRATQCGLRVLAVGADRPLTVHYTTAQRASRSLSPLGTGYAGSALWADQHDISPDAWLSTPAGPEVLPSPLSAGIGIGSLEPAGCFGPGKDSWRTGKPGLLFGEHESSNWSLGDTIRRKKPRAYIQAGPIAVLRVSSPPLFVMGENSDEPSVHSAQLDVHGHRVEISFANLVLAAGGLGNVYFLKQLLADRVAAARSHLLGRGYMNHPKTITLDVDLDRPRSMRRLLGGSRLGEWIRSRTLDDGQLGTDKRGLRISHRFWPSWESRLLGAPWSRRLWSKSGIVERLSVMSYFEVPALPSNSVLVDLDFPNYHVEANHDVPDWTIEQYERSVHRMHAYLADLPFVRNVTFRRIDWSSLLGTDAHHYMGTTRMADSPSGGVVNTFGRVFGIENCYVVGTSVLPVGSPLHPTRLAAGLSQLALGEILTRNGDGTRPNEHGSAK